MINKDIGIIGGTFNPVHYSHIMMAAYLSQTHIVDEIWVMPSYNSPHKGKEIMKTYNDRLKMAELGFFGIERVKISDYEKDYYEFMKETYGKEVKTYTYDILKSLKNKFINVNFYLIVGFDSIKDIDTWYRANDLLEEFPIYVFDREDEDFDTVDQKLYYIFNIGKYQDIKPSIELLNIKLPNISSNEIRTLLRKKNVSKTKILKLIPETVYNYIMENDLYI